MLCFRAEAGDSVWCLRISGSNSSTGARHQVTNDLTPSLFGVSLYLFLVAGQREVIFMRRGVPRDMATPLGMLTSLQMELLSQQRGYLLLSGRTQMFIIGIIYGLLGVHLA